MIQSFQSAATTWITASWFAGDIERQFCFTRACRAGEKYFISHRDLSGDAFDQFLSRGSEDIFSRVFLWFVWEQFLSDEKALSFVGSWFSLLLFELLDLLSLVLQVCQSIFSRLRQGSIIRFFAGEIGVDNIFEESLVSSLCETNSTKCIKGFLVFFSFVCKNFFKYFCNSVGSISEDGIYFINNMFLFSRISLYFFPSNCSSHCYFKEKLANPLRSIRDLIASEVKLIEISEYFQTKLFCESLTLFGGFLRSIAGCANSSMSIVRVWHTLRVPDVEGECKDFFWVFFWAYEYMEVMTFVYYTIRKLYLLQINERE